MMLTQTEKQHSSQSRTFQVGVVGASETALNALQRIFKVTDFRTRRYQAVPLHSASREVDTAIDFIVLCTSNPQVLSYWQSRQPMGPALQKPFIRFTREAQAGAEDYLMTLPANPSRLLKLLDNYTIRELAFFPEYQIGENARSDNDRTAAGLQLLQSRASSASQYPALKRALVVDDSSLVHKQMRLEFSLLNTELDLVVSAEEAIDECAQAAYDIIFLDVVLPGLDGYSACKRIKRSAVNKQAPVVLLTSRSSSFDKLKGSLAGCDAYLVKPINHNEFLKVINRFFDEAPAEQH